MGRRALPNGSSSKLTLDVPSSFPGAAICPCADYVATRPQGSRSQPPSITSLPTRIHPQVRLAS